MQQLQADSWLGTLRTQLYAKEMQLIFKKHHVLLYKLFAECGRLSQANCSRSTTEEIEQNAKGE
jgi:hypothetical protein